MGSPLYCVKDEILFITAGNALIHQFYPKGQSSPLIAVGQVKDALYGIIREGMDGGEVRDRVVGQMIELLERNCRLSESQAEEKAKQVFDKYV